MDFESSDEEGKPLVPSFPETLRSSRHGWLRRQCSTVLLVLLFANVLLMLITAICLYLLATTAGLVNQGQRIDCFDDTLLNPPIVWEQRTFNSTVDIAKDAVTDSFEPVSPTTSADWGRVLDVGEIRISREEAARLPSETAPLYGGEEGYAGVLEVFHQLHCLNRIRKKFYNLTVHDDSTDSERLNTSHDKHCFNYLWQTLLCHADVSVMSVGWNDEQKAFNANFAVTKQCRNFNVIHNWAKNREAKFPPPGDTHPGRIESEDGMNE